MRREVVLFFAIFTVAVLFTEASFAADTELNFYRPMTETSKQPPLILVDQKKGVCQQQSKLIKREDAWNCVADNKVYDPCFVLPYGSHMEAVCPEAPWSSKGVKIKVTAPLDNKEHVPLDMSRTYPWAIQLSTGEKCQAVNTNKEYDGLPVHYQCEGNSELIGHVQRCDNPWKILKHAANGVDTAQIVRAWF